MPQIQSYGGFEQIKAAVFLCHINYEKYRKLNLTVELLTKDPRGNKTMVK